MSYQVTLQPSQHQFRAEPDQSVLDAALAAGILLPYSCRSGACSTCKARVVTGTCDAGPTVAQVLAPGEIDEGYTLLCQARATSDLVIESREVRLVSDIQVRKLPARVTEMRRMAPDVTLLTASDAAIRWPTRRSLPASLNCISGTCQAACSPTMFSAPAKRP